jgi:hypothetical protein
MRSRTLRAGPLALVALAAWALAVPALAADAAKVTILIGNATATYADGRSEALVKGGSVAVGAKIHTGEKTKLELRLSDTSVIRLGSKSDLELRAAHFSGKGTKNVSAELLTGQAYASVSKLVGSDSKFEISTGTAVAGVRGTAFRIDAKANDRSTVVRVYTGSVAVSNAPLFQKKAGKDGAPVKKKCPGVKPCRDGVAEVAGPHEVSKKEWEEFVAKAMQEVRVAGDGTMSAPVAFDAQQELQDDPEGWIAWNKDMDKAQAVE